MLPLAVDHEPQDNQEGSKTDSNKDNDWDDNSYSGGASSLRLSGGWAGRGWGIKGKEGREGETQRVGGEMGKGRERESRDKLKGRD